MENFKIFLRFIIPVLGLVLTSYIGNYYYIVYYLLFLVGVFMLFLEYRKISDFSPFLLPEISVFKLSLCVQGLSFTVLLFVFLLWGFQAITFTDYKFVISGFFMIWFIYLMIEYRLYTMVKLARNS